MKDPAAPGFDDMKLQVGAKLQLFLRRSPKTVYYPILIGWVTGDYVLLKIPFDHGLAVPILEGEEVAVRVFSGVSVFTFNSVVESLQLNPRYQMYLSFPKAIQAIPLRSAPRVPVSLPVQVKAGAGTEVLEATLTDLSISGAMVMADHQFGKPGDAIGIAFSFRVQPTNQEVRIDAHATIRSCQQLHGNLPEQQNGNITFSYGVGIHFDDIAPDSQVMLQHYVYEQAA